MIIDRKDLKVGDVIYILRSGEQTGNEKDIKITIDQRIDTKIRGVKGRVFLGGSKDYRATGMGRWSSLFIKD